MECGGWTHPERITEGRDKGNSRVSFENGFDWKQPKLEPKLVSALSKTKHLFRLFRFYTETESFGIPIEPKQREEQPKQFDREHILVFFTENIGLFRFVLGCFETVRFYCCLVHQNREFRCFV
jgi:hypothetical protein